MRIASTVNPVLLQSLKRYRDHEAATERKRMRLLDEAREQTKSLSSTKLQLEETQAQLKAAQRELKDAEQALVAKRAVKSYSMTDLGEGKKNCEEPRAPRPAVKCLIGCPASGKGSLLPNAMTSCGSKKPGMRRCF